MYENRAMLAVFLLIYSAIARRIERSLISGPIMFTAIAYILGMRTDWVFCASTSTARDRGFSRN